MIVRDMLALCQESQLNAHFNTNTSVFMRPRAVNTPAFNSIIVLV